MCRTVSTFTTFFVVLSIRFKFLCFPIVITAQLLPKGLDKSCCSCITLKLSSHDLRLNAYGLFSEWLQTIHSMGCVESMISTTMETLLSIENVLEKVLELTIDMRLSHFFIFIFGNVCIVVLQMLSKLLKPVLLSPTDLHHGQNFGGPVELQPFCSSEESHCKEGCRSSRERGD